MEPRYHSVATWLPGPDWLNRDQGFRDQRKDATCGSPVVKLNHASKTKNRMRTGMPVRLRVKSPVPDCRDQLCLAARHREKEAGGWPRAVRFALSPRFDSRIPVRLQRS